MEDIGTAIMHGAEAGKLRAFVRKDGGVGLRSLERLADRHSAASAAALQKMMKREAADMAALFVVRDRPGSR